MKNSITSCLLAAMLLTGVSCRKKLDSSNAELVGTWDNDTDTEIQINSNGKGYSHYNDGGSYKNIDGKVKVEGETITFKAVGFKESYTINKRPYKKSGKTLMELNGEVYEQH